jgi:uncharacterized protein (TIGR02271 family)
MTERTLTAMYDTRGAAETARDDLVALGVSSGAIGIRGSEGGPATASTTTEEPGFWASLADLFAPDEDRHTYAEGLRRGAYLLSARIPEGMEEPALDVLERSGAVDIDERAESWRQGGWQGYEAQTPAYGATAAAPAPGAADATAPGLAEGSTAYAESGRGSDLPTAELGTGRTEGEGMLPVAEEELRVGKQEVGRGGVRVRSYIVERPVEEQVALRDETVRVERRPVDRPLEPGDAAFEEKVIEAVERDEEAVVSKRARVVEEVALHKDVDTRTETVRDTVRKQEVEVEDEDDQTARGVAGTDETIRRDRTKP